MPEARIIITITFNIANKVKQRTAGGMRNALTYVHTGWCRILTHIIRKNRNAIAVLNGEESQEDLKALGKDVFNYFGLGCRNVAKIYVPDNYQFDNLLESLHEYREIVRHNKYKNNFDYNFAIQVLNKVPYFSNGCIIMVENNALTSRVGELYFEYFSDPSSVENEIKSREDEIQCVVAREGWLNHPTVTFGKAQQPELWDYADGVDTMAFLLKV